MRPLFSLAFACCLFSALSAHGQIHLTPLNDKESVKFQIKNFGLPVDGSFSSLTGEIVWDEIHLENNSFDVSINASSINTGIALRDKHLRKDDYFDVVKFPLVRFKSTKISTTQAGVFQIDGELFIKKTNKVISFPFKVIRMDDEYVFSGQFVLDRTVYGIGNNSLSLSNNVRVFLNIRAMKSKVTN